MKTSTENNFMTITPIDTLRSQFVRTQGEFTTLFDEAKAAVQSGDQPSAKVVETKSAL